jgi:hypothetical protein
MHRRLFRIASLLESAIRLCGARVNKGMNVRPVPARGGATGKTSVSQRQEYIPGARLSAETGWQYTIGSLRYTTQIQLPGGSAHG